MKKNQIEFKIKNKQGIEKLVIGFIEENRVKNRSGAIFKCSCTGNTDKTATPFEYNGTQLICPECGKIGIITMTYDDYLERKKKQEKEAEELERKKLEDLHLVMEGKDWECGFNFYGLSARIDYDHWLKIKKFFTYRTPGWSKDQELEWYGWEPTGWLTQNPNEVEEILIKEGLIKQENTMKARSDKAKKEAEKEKKLKEEKLKTKKEIDEYFENAEHPENIEENMENLKNGEKIENPNYPENIYGGGEWWVITKKFIWRIKNNGFDGANWGLNNIHTGGAGAIGHRVKYNSELEKLIRKYVDLFYK